MGHGKRSKSYQLYLHPDQPADVMLLDLLEACKGVGRGPQEFFREALRTGIRAMYEAGDIPPEVVKRAKLHKFYQGLPVRGMPPVINAFPIPQGYAMPVVDQSGDVDSLPAPEPREARQVVRLRPPAAEEPAVAHEAEPEIVEIQPEEPAAEPGTPSAILGLMGRRARKPEQQGA